MRAWVLLLLCCGVGHARPISDWQAANVVDGWFKAGVQPFCDSIGRANQDVEAVTDADGNTIYYIVSREPEGFVIVAADDEVEPIIAFSDSGTLDPSVANPLTDLLRNDVRNRIHQIRQRHRNRGRNVQQSPGERQSTHAQASHRWSLFADLANESEGDGLVIGATLSIPDIRVEPLLETRWAQDEVCGQRCYNYYTPGNYQAGCVAIALAQLVRYHQHPTSGIGQKAFLITSEGQRHWAFTLGGNGYGGPYWYNGMVPVPACSTSKAERQAIGTICHDAGLSINTDYGASGSEADTLAAKLALKNTFNYGNAIKGYNDEENIGAGLIAMINPNLDVGDPVILGIRGTSGHAAVCDGYGYHGSTLYHHLNMGWANASDAWYNLPNVNTSPAYSSVHKCVYNIQVTEAGDGEVVSGRVLDQSGTPLANAIVTIREAGQSIGRSILTNDRGIYGFKTLLSQTQYSGSAFADGHLFEEHKIVTGTSRDGAAASGNLWGIDLQGTDLQISEVEPTSGPIRGFVTIRGDNFGVVAGNVFFAGGRKGESVIWDNTSISCRVPADASSGSLWIRTSNGANSTLASFEVTESKTLIVNAGEATAYAENGTASHPFSRIQHAIDAAADGSEIIVEPGVYEETIQFRGRNITLRCSEPEDPTIVAETVIDAGGEGPVVVFEGTEGPKCVLDGLTIVNGIADNGAGIFCGFAQPTIRNCAIINNVARENGGGLYCIDRGARVMNCELSSNIAGGDGGAISCTSGTLHLLQTTLTNNAAEGRGGAVFASDSSLEVTRCRFGANVSTGGGAVANFDGALTLTNCAMADNYAHDDGGALYNRNGEAVSVVNCTFRRNAASDLGGGIYNSNGDQQVNVVNSILWANSDASGTTLSSQIHGGEQTINYTCVQGWDGSREGQGNIGMAPGFVDADAGNSLEADTPTTSVDFDALVLTARSPCIDAGDNNAVLSEAFDPDGNPRVLDDPAVDDTGRGSRPIVDMGAFERCGLLAHWKLDEAGGTRAHDSASLYDGNILGAAAWTTQGAVRGALAFDGNDDAVRIDAESAFDMRWGITVAAWVRIDALERDWQTVIAKGDSAWRLSTYQDSSRMHFAVTGGPEYYQANSQTALHTNQWYHVCGTYDGRRIRLFINGSEDVEQSVEYTGGISTNDEPVFISNNSQKERRHWKGLVDDLRVYNYALKPAEIERILCPGAGLGDLNGDCVVDMRDFAVLTAAWLSRPGDSAWNPQCDISDPADNVVDQEDMNIFIANWLAGL